MVGGLVRTCLKYPTKNVQFLTFTEINYYGQGTIYSGISIKVLTNSLTWDSAHERKFYDWVSTL